MAEEFEIKKEYNYQRNNKKIVNVPKNIQEIFANSINDDAITIHTLRIFSVILSRIKGNEIKDSNQYSLFSDEFLFDNKTAIRFNYKLSDFAPKGTTSYSHVKNALKELVKYQIDVPKKIKRPDGKTITFFSGIISNLVMEEKGKVSFDMSSYWYCRFIYTATNFNKHLVDLFFKSKEVKDIAFYTFLLQIPKGTTMKISTLNTKFNINYSTYSELERGFLQPLREKFNSLSDVSFNFSKLNNNLISIKPYYLDSKPKEEIKERIKTRTSEAKRVINRLNYLKKKHQLEEVEFNILSSLFNKYSMGFFNEILKSNKKVLSDLKGEVFLSRLSDIYISQIKNTKK